MLLFPQPVDRPSRYAGQTRYVIHIDGPEHLGQLVACHHAPIMRRPCQTRKRPHLPRFDTHDASACDDPTMTDSASRAILARNLLRRIDADTPRGQRTSIRAWALGKGLDVRLIHRIAKREHAVSIDTLEQIAEALGLQPWHLLLEDLEPGATPDAPITEDERAMLRKLRRLLDQTP